MASVTQYDTAKGKRYRARYRTPEHRQTDKRGFKTKRDAELFLASVTVSKARGEFVEVSAGRVTVADLAPAWLAGQKTNVKPSTYVWHEGAVRVYVLPRWGNTRIADIRHSDVQAWISALAAGSAPSTKRTNKPLGPASVRRAYGVLAAILDVAVKDRRLTTNPARDVKLPRKTTRRRNYLDHAQVERLALAAGEYGTLARFLAYTGLRWGEAIALRVEDLDMLRRRVSVHRAVSRVNGQMIEGTPKTHTERSVPFPAFLAPDLARLCEGKTRGALVFGNGRTFLGQPTHRDAWFTKALAAVRADDETFPEITAHDLRHTAASLAISAGANVKAVQRMLGHASAAMTLDTYADLFDDDLDAVSTALDEARSAANVGKNWAETLA